MTKTPTKSANPVAVAKTVRKKGFKWLDFGIISVFYGYFKAPVCDMFGKIQLCIQNKAQGFVDVAVLCSAKFLPYDEHPKESRSTGSVLQRE